MYEANLSGANLSGANLTSTDLRKADLSRADLSGANLETVWCNRANLTGVTGISVEELEKGAYFEGESLLKGAIMPDGSIHP